jgi:hypothetical protein
MEPEAKQGFCWNDMGGDEDAYGLILDVDK